MTAGMGVKVKIGTQDTDVDVWRTDPAQRIRETALQLTAELRFSPGLTGKGAWNSHYVSGVRVHLRTVTDDLASGVFSSLYCYTVLFAAWIADVQD